MPSPVRPPAPLDAAAVAATSRPFGQARMLPAEAYTSAEVLAWERRHVFDGGWVCVGRVEALQRAAQSAVQVGATSVLVTRSGDSRLAAFANICRHRGHELLPCGAATDRGVVQCPYHAWTYELDGRLRLAPHVGGMGNVVPDELRLLPVPSEQWGGWLFVNVDGAALPLAEHLGDLAGLVAPWGPADLRIGATHHYELAANWKIAIENYHECGHCPLIHPELCRVSPANSGVNVELSGAFVGGAMQLADGAATMSLDGGSPLAPLAGLDDERRRQVLYVQLFPNLLLSLHPDYVMTHRIQPRTPSIADVECQWLFAPDAVAEPGFDPSFAVDFWDVTNRQDWAAVESVQRGIESCRFEPGVFAANEDAVYHFATMMAAAYQGHPPTAARIGAHRPTAGTVRRTDP
ncbi:MAG: aromatic ring-hydroxylating dioxygenase subunit alpha [Ilumatobacteraceae bacterium]